MMRARALLLGVGIPLALLAVSPRPAGAQVNDRYNHTVTQLPNGNLLIVGGESDDGTLVASPNDVEVFVSTANTLFTAATMGAAFVRSSHTATLLADGRVLVAGGFNAAYTPMSDARVYNPVANTWTAVGALNTARGNHTATLLPNGTVMVAGGQTTVGGSVTTSCEIFTPGADTFAPCAGNMLASRAGHTATLLYNGRVFVAGGYTDGGNPIRNTMELFNYQTGLWQPAAGGALMTRRTGHTATVLGNRNVMLVGGFSGKNITENFGFLETAEIYNPVSDSMMPPPPPMASRKALHTAILSDDGQLKVFGGLGNITTNYFNGPLGWESGSFISLSSVTASTASFAAAATNLTVRISRQMTPQVVGTVVTGQVYFGNPRTTRDDTLIYFVKNDNRPEPYLPADNPHVRLDGTELHCNQTSGGCGWVNDLFTLNNPTGTVHFIPKAVTSKDGIISSLAAPLQSTFTFTDITGSSIVVQGQTGTISQSTFTMDIDIPLSSNFIGAQMLEGTAVITAGEVVRAGAWSASLTGGTGSIGGATVVTDAGGQARYRQTVTFTGVSGTITATTTTVTSPEPVIGLKATSLGLQITYVMNRINMEGGSFEFGAATVAINMMTFGDLEVYNPSNNQWTLHGSHFLPGMFSMASVYSPNGDHKIFGGRICDQLASPVGTCAGFTSLATSRPYGYIPAPASETPWQTDAALNRKRGSHTATLLPSGNVLVAGGVDGSEPLASAELYDPVGQRWVPTGDMKRARSGHTATLLPNGTVLVAGGYVTGESTGATSLAEIFYPESGQWVRTGPMISSRQFHTATLLPDGNVLVAGGYDSTSYLGSAEIYYSTEARWRPAGNLTLPGGRADHTATLLQDGRVLLVGGVNASGETLTVEAYDLSSGWTAAPTDMPAGAGEGGTGRFGHAATLLKDGRVLITGGDDGFMEIATALVYDPLGGVNGTWTRVQDLPGGGNAMVRGRLRHQAVLSPSGRVHITGGQTSLGSSIDVTEDFNVEATTFSYQGKMTTARAGHTTTLLANGFMLNAGGAIAPQVHTANSDRLYLGGFPDVATGGGASIRQPKIASVNNRNFDRSANVTINGSSLKGMTEATGGGSGSQFSGFHHPRVSLQALDRPGSYLLDLTDRSFLYSTPWSTIDSSITFTVPASVQLPYGWYQLRASANAQYSDAMMVQAGPPTPTGAPGLPSGNLIGTDSVLWTWDTAAAGGGTIEGYRIYSSSTGVFLSTHTAACAGSICRFLQTGLAPNDTISIKVAAYNISGDGPRAVSTMSFTTPSADITGVFGVAMGTGTISWSWTNVGIAFAYKVYNSTNGVLLGTPATNSFTQVNLSTNTQHSIRVVAVTSLGDGPLSPSASAYTLAMIPAGSFTPITNVSTGGFLAQWLSNSNPAGTDYRVRISTIATGGPAVIDTLVDGTFAAVIDQTPNTPYFPQVAAVNGDGIETAYIALGSTYTLANRPANLRVTGNSYSSIDVVWEANGNPSYTAYQVVYSTDNFATSRSTPVPFGLGFTGTGVQLTNLLTGINYTIRVMARNQLGVETAAAEVSTVTYNGGAPAGQLAVVVNPGTITDVSGTINSNRLVGVRVLPGTFSEQVVLTISSRTAIAACQNPVTLNAAITVTTDPPRQPVFPIELKISYLPSEITSASTLAMIRHEPNTNTCVPLRSAVDQVAATVTSQINHLSDFQLQQLSPQSGLGNARAFPNPLYIKNQGYITFDRLPARARIRIYTLMGEEILEGQSNDSGLFTWNARNKDGRAVGSGLYLVLIEAGGQRETMKVGVVR